MSLTNSPKIFRGIRFRLTIVYSTLFGLFICAFAYIITRQHFQAGRDDFDSGLINYAIDLSNHLIYKDQSTLTFNLPANEINKVFPFVLKETSYFVRSLDGQILSKSPSVFPFNEIPYDPHLSIQKDYTHRIHSFESEGKTYRAINLKITTKSNKSVILQVATIYEGVLEREQNQLLVTSLMVPVLIIVSSFFSYLIAGNALLPIKVLTDTASSIAAKNLSERVPVVNTGDEVEELGSTLNNLLERLEVSFRAQENFVANASHQLNTPLAIIKGELDVLQSKNRTPEEISKFHMSLREELERLIDLVKNMLLVSRVKSGLEQFVFYPIRLDDLLLTTSTRLQTKAREKKITIRYDIDLELNEDDLVIQGEKQLLDSLFENILDNAIKYSPDESTVLVAIKKPVSDLEVWIQDEGPGISGEIDQTNLGTRFQRGGANFIPGTGIGLAIAKKIASFHKAEIIYQNAAPKGSLFIVRFAKHQQASLSDKMSQA